MADSKKISELEQVSAPATTDEFVVVDKSSTSGADAGAKGKTSRITFGDLKDAVGTSGPSGPAGARGLAGPMGTQGIPGPAGPVAGTDKQFVYNDNGSAAGAEVYYRNGVEINAVSGEALSIINSSEQQFRIH